MRGISLEGIEKTATCIRKKSGKYIIYSFLEKRQLTKGYDKIDEIGKNIYMGMNKKSGRVAFLSSRFSTKDKYEKIVKLVDDEEIYYIGIIEEDKIELLNKCGSIEIEKLSKEEHEKITRLLKEEKENGRDSG